MHPVALNTVVYNEAHRIVGLLDHASSFCDELVVVDQGSTDGTADLARDYGATVILDHHYGFCEPSRPLAAEHTKSDWIICLDADETITRVDDLNALDEQFLGAKFAMISLVDGVRIDPMFNGRYRRNLHLRYFRKGVVTYTPEIHTYIRTPFSPELFFEDLDGPEWLLNSKQQWEWDLDLARYADHGWEWPW